MREIKFRAWHKKEYFIAKVTSIDWDEKLVQTEWLTWKEDGAVKLTDDPFRNVRHFDEVELMQFTGLKDRDGKEIYEGDILQMRGCRGFVEYEEGVFNVERRKNKIPYNKNKRIPYIDWPSEFYYRCKIIGNIYETPELLEK
jgi:uncharacterized phage protein (TIGR01671 family)